jgi:kynurenine formamidase
VSAPPAAFSELPSYGELLQRTDAPPGASWGLFGPGAAGDLGTLALLCPEQVRLGAASVVTGERHALNYPIDAFDPPLLATRPAAQLTLSSRHAEHLDDVLDGFNPQSSSQIDGLRHRRHERHGFYNNASTEEIAQTSRLGVQGWAEKGIAGRGIVLDVERLLGGDDPHEWHSQGSVVTADDLEASLHHQNVSMGAGDIVLLHTGWAGWYLDDLDDAGRERVRTSGRFTGMEQSRTVLEWIWDHRVPLLASDTYALERLPAVAHSPFTSQHDGGMMHQEMLALLGLAVGELWRLRELARACARDERWTCLVTSAPLNVRGGVSTTANAMALR